MPTAPLLAKVVLALAFVLAVAGATNACSADSGGQGSTKDSGSPPADVAAQAHDSSAQADSGASSDASGEASAADVTIMEAATDAPADGGPDATPDATMADGGPSEAATDAADAMADASDAAPTYAVTFQYTPGWSGVTAVSVVGGFGQATDWKPLEPFVNLVANGQGGFSASTELPAGTYSYLYLVTGDEAAANPATYARYVIDPANSAYAACPPSSPTFSDAAPQPCSHVTVPQAASPTLYRVSGSVTSSGAPEPGYLVVIGRDETGSQSFMANRTNTQAKSDGGAGDGGGAGTFDFLVAAGHYQLEVLHPTLLAETDEQRVPTTLQAIRRAVSSAVDVQGTTTFPNVDVAYTAAEYDALSPRTDGDGGAVLPTHFAFTLVTGSHGAAVAVYGPGSNVQDPFWQSATEHDGGTVVFDGGFDLSTGAGTGVVAGTQYWWGVWQYPPASDAGVSWSSQSMVFPITWQ